MNTDSKAQNAPLAKKEAKSLPGVRNSRLQAVLRAFLYCLNHKSRNYWAGFILTKPCVSLQIFWGSVISQRRHGCETSSGSLGKLTARKSLADWRESSMICS